MAAFDKLQTSSYASSIVTMSVSSTVTEILSVEYWPDLVIWVRGSLLGSKNQSFQNKSGKAQPIRRT